MRLLDVLDAIEANKDKKKRGIYPTLVYGLKTAIQARIKLEERAILLGDGSDEGSKVPPVIFEIMKDNKDWEKKLKRAHLPKAATSNRHKS